MQTGSVEFLDVITYNSVSLGETLGTECVITRSDVTQSFHELLNRCTTQKSIVSLMNTGEMVDQRFGASVWYENGNVNISRWNKGVGGADNNSSPTMGGVEDVLQLDDIINILSIPEVNSVFCAVCVCFAWL